VQLVNQPTHGGNILDKVFTNRPDCFSTLVSKCLVKTKHLSVLVSPDPLRKKSSDTRVKINIFDLRVHNIDYLRYTLGTHDWSKCLASTDIHYVYDTFLIDVHHLIDQCIPKKSVTVGSRDPPYVTSLVKSMLVKRNRLRKKGRLEEANRLAEKINLCIQDARAKQYSKMSQASPKQLWAAVKTTNGAHGRTHNHLFTSRCRTCQ